MKMTDYVPGTPCWVDLMTTDLDGAKAFYGGLFGWTAQVADDPAAGGYVLFELDGVQAAGGMKTMSADQPTAWSTYVAVTDADATMAKATAAGAQPIVAPMDVTDVGRMAMFADPTGAILGLWQPRSMKGAGVVNEPGALTWDELNTRDAAAAKTFYAAAFGWTAETSAMGEGMEYTELQVDGRTVAGLMEMDDEHFPKETPPHWAVYFGVADCDASVAKVGALGGTVVVPTTPIPPGWFAVCQDPQGGFFSLFEAKEPAGAAS
ncbi:VOC family protein [Catenulispora sp. NF23]|uniref:VOC family protein n=1 Tax=Catenulispora pinistramenti TaxID=2705254 RepID=A0ABS5KNT3_9ACTN|nr:VOC family protein [Catenulispora pinistramenti]MBS2531779.1 VOC family protein [Catenulispora pinistramenti]MBS2547675.1 VOC family protein [Catenulispora pinistramenti]